MQKTKIDWATYSWGPVSGCLNACPFCYAKKIAERFGEKVPEYFNKKDIWVIGSKRPRTQKDGKRVYSAFPYGFSPTFHKYRLEEPQHHKKPQRIFVCSMADLFGPWIPDEWIMDVFNACNKAPQHKYMFLTKFPERYADLAHKGLLPQLDNFWYGQSASSGTVKAFLGPYHQFLSAEPLFGVVEQYGFDLVIIGAETGNRKEKMIPSKGTVEMTRYYSRCSVFMKDSLVPIIGEDNMIRNLPKDLLVGKEVTD